MSVASIALAKDFGKEINRMRSWVTTLRPVQRQDCFQSNKKENGCNLVTFVYSLPTSYCEI